MPRKLTLREETTLTSATSFEQLWGSLNNDEWFSYMMLFNPATGCTIQGYRNPDDEKCWHLHMVFVSKLKLALGILNAHFQFRDKHPYVETAAVGKAQEVFIEHTLFPNDTMLHNILFELLRNLASYSTGLKPGDMIGAGNQRSLIAIDEAKN